MAGKSYSRNSSTPSSSCCTWSAWILVLVFLNGCASTVIGTATDAAIEIVKVPFKVGAAVIDVVSGDDEEDEDEDENDDE